MKVSIITPSYNSAKTICDTLDSVRNQTFQNIEHIVIDGLSPDGTATIVKQHAPAAICLSEKDNGIYDAMNKGIRLATGDIIGILNSDDFYTDQNVIEKVTQLFETTGCDALYGDLVYVDPQDTKRIVRKWTAGELHVGKFLNGWMPPHPTFFVKRAIYEKYGLFNTSLKISADYELMLRFLYKHGISATYFPQCLVCMRTGGHSNASLRRRFDANKEDRMAWKLNNLEPRFYTTWLKPIRKIPQFM